MVSVGFAAVGTWMVLNRYTGPWAPFVQPTRQLLSAALAHDSTRLARLSVSPSLVHFLLEAAGQHPEQFASFSELRAIGGQRVGDTTQVTFAHQWCSDNLLILTFRGSASQARVQDINLPCASR